MKIAIVIPTAWYSDNPSKFSVDLGLYIQAITDSGHEPILICGQNSVYDVSYPVLSATLEEIEQEQFWRDLSLDVAIVFTWLRHPKILRALGSAKVYTVSRADMDGQLSVRVFPLHHYRMTMNGLRNPWDKLRNFRHWVRRYIKLSRQADQEVIDSIVAADAIMIETTTAKRRLEQFLTYYRMTELREKIFVQPHYVADDLLSCDVVTTRLNKIVAIGRWEDPQKDAILMSAALDIYLAKRPDTKVVLIGSNGAEVFASLLKKYQNVHCIGVIPRADIRQHLSDCRILLSTSLWEGAPVSASETLSLGGTVVGPAIPGIEGFCLTGQFGNVSMSRRPVHVVQAIEEEMAAWENGERNPEEIANHWRPKLSAINSIKQIVQMATQHQHSTPPTLLLN